MTIRQAALGTVHSLKGPYAEGISAGASPDAIGARGIPRLTLVDPGAEYTASGARIVILDDDSAMRHALLDYLQHHELRASSAASRSDLLRVMSCHEPDLVVLDLQAAQHERLDLLREIRSLSDVPVILTTDPACDEVDRILGLELGADDCLAKPFSLRELLARIRALLRRNVIARNPVRRAPERGGFRFAGWQLHRRSHRLTAPSGETVPLTKGEYALLLAFLGAPKRPLSREQLLLATRIHDDAFHRSIDVQVMRLRRKLEIDPAAPRFIQTERGVGYAFAILVEPY